ncbi:MAG: enoyl-CoA hydratase/isomerase family protein, partial [Actinomycetia bacterium]|nr:enoyl-CoA hydratase/isomerase family protein [Actinomycetes bacterium]
MPKSEGWLILNDVKARTEVVNKNGSASLLDLGDGVACLQFHSKMNSLDADIGKMYIDALDRLDADEFDALVVGNQDGPAFCAGANVFVVLMMSMQKQWDKLDEMLVGLQSTLMRAKYNKKPVVTAPRGLTLGGGAEVAMHSTATVAQGELYMGLVEVGVGLIPGAGGCKEMLVRYLGDIPEGTEYDPNPFVQAAFKNIGLASVATSAEEARSMRYLRPQDKVTIDPDAVVADAKKMARGLADAGFVPPHQRKVKLPGASGRSAIELFL